MFAEDARAFLRRTSRRYDVVVHDTFTGGTTPEHLLSVEVVQRIHQILEPGGVLALSFAWFDRGPKAKARWAVARTLRAVFRNVRVFRDGPPGRDPDEAANPVFLASDGPVTDARNPLARLRIPVAEDHFHAMNELLPAGVWLH